MQPQTPAPATWLALVANLPTQNAGARMRIMRTLEALGCAVLTEGVYFLPDNPAHRKAFDRLAEYVRQCQGQAHILSVHHADETQAIQFRAMFSRRTIYQELIKTIESLSAGFGVSEPTSIAKVLAKQRREFEAVGVLDFFPDDMRARTAQALSDAEAAVREQMFPGGAMDAPATPRTPASGKFLGRIWATRKPLWADRLTSAWLIRRFIDPEATLIWLEKDQECPASAIGYGFDGATFNNTAERVTFEELLASFGLEKNTALRSIGALVHHLDANGPEVPEAHGVATLLKGAARRALGEDELQRETEKTFDLLYDAYFDAPAKG